MKRIRICYCPYCGYAQPKPRKSAKPDEIEIIICLNVNCFGAFQADHAKTELVDSIQQSFGA